MSLRHTVRLTGHRGHRIISAPSVEPVTVADLATFLRISGASENDVLADCISESRLMIENRIGVAMIDQSWLLTLDAWPAGGVRQWDGVVQGPRDMMRMNPSLIDVEMPRWPLSSITSINVYDEDGNATAVTVADVFDTDTNSIPGRLSLKSGASWPVALRSNNAIEITYVAGYGAAAAAVPDDLKRAVKNLAGALYATRGDGCGDDELFAKAGVNSVLSTYKVWRV